MNAAARLGDALSRLADSPDDGEAWATIYARLWPFVFSICFRMLRERTEAEDVSQETFLRIARYFPFARRLDEKIFTLYIGQVARRASLDAIRRNRHAAAEMSIEEAVEAPDPDAHPGEVAEVASTLEWLTAQLSASDAELCRELVENAPLSPAELANTLGVSYSAAAVRLHRLRERIRKLLGSRIRGL